LKLIIIIVFVRDIIITKLKRVKKKDHRTAGRVFKGRSLFWFWVRLLLTKIERVQCGKHLLIVNY